MSTAWWPVGSNSPAHRCRTATQTSPAAVRFATCARQAFAHDHERLVGLTVAVCGVRTGARRLGFGAPRSPAAHAFRSDSAHAQARAPSTRARRTRLPQSL